MSKKVKHEEFCKDIADENTSTSLLSSTCGIRTKLPTSKGILNKSQLQDSEPKMKALSILERDYIPKKVSFRNEEEKIIKKFVQSALDGELRCKCLLATGMPGAGKTMICNKVLQTFKKAKVLRYNGGSIKNIQTLLRRLIGDIYNEDFPSNSSITVSDILKQLEINKLSTPCIVMIDEFDYLFLQDSTGTSLELFSLTTELTFICTSNSMQFIQKLSEKFKTVLPAITNVVFKPYSAQELEKIVEQKIVWIEEQTGIKLIFQNRCLRYISGKVFNGKGADMRKFFDQVLKIVKHVLESQPAKTEGSTKIYEVTMEDATAFLKQSSELDMMCSLPLQQQLLLVGIYNFFKEADMLQANIEDLHKEVDWISKSLGTKPIGNYDLKQGVKYLGCYGYVTVKEKKGDMKIIPKVDLDKIVQSFQNHDLLGKFFQEKEKNI